jgi:hypothetical protein
MCSRPKHTGNTLPNWVRVRQLFIFINNSQGFEGESVPKPFGRSPPGDRPKVWNVDSLPDGWKLGIRDMEVCDRQGGLLLLLVLVAGASTQVATQPVSSGSWKTPSTNAATGNALPQEVGAEIWAGELVWMLPPSTPQSSPTLLDICCGKCARMGEHTFGNSTGCSFFQGRHDICFCDPSGLIFPFVQRSCAYITSTGRRAGAPGRGAAIQRLSELSQTT